MNYLNIILSLSLLYSATAGAQTIYLQLRVGEKSRISAGGIKRTDGLVSPQDQREHAYLQTNLDDSESLKFLRAAQRGFYISSFETSHITDQKGRESFELRMKLLGSSEVKVLGWFTQRKWMLTGSTLRIQQRWLCKPAISYT
jgi:hypothetical protein